MNQIFQTDITSALLVAVFAGLLVGIPTGPARFLVVDTCLNDGKSPALQVYGGLFTAFLVYAGVAFVAHDFISGNKTIESFSYLAASFLLIVWGIIIIFKSKENKNSSISLNLNSWYKKGFVVGISNPVIPFLYLTILQLLKVYSTNPSLIGNVLLILVFEIISFLTLSVITLILLNKKNTVMDYWRKVKLMMGIFLVTAGSFHTFQQLDFSNGIKVKDNKNILEEQIHKSQKQVKKMKG